MTTEFNTFKDWMLNQFTHNDLADLCLYGAQGSFSGLIYHHETTALYEQYHAEIWQSLCDDCQDFGLDSCLELMSTFAIAKDVMSDAEHKNLLVWYLAEKIARDVTDGEYLSNDISDDLGNTN